MKDTPVHAAEQITILYLDDEPDALLSFSMLFRFDFKVLTTTSPTAARKLLDTHRVDIILCDQRMPQMTGIEFFMAIIDRYPDAIRLLITGYTDVNVVIDAINRCRVHRYIAKPYDEKELRSIIRGAARLYGQQVSKGFDAARQVMRTHLDRLEQRRYHISGRLHDDLAQKLAGIKFMMAALANDPRSKGYALLQRSDQTLNGIIRDLRAISFELMPMGLVSDGLVQTLKELGLRMGQDKQVALDFTTTQPTLRIEKSWEVIIFRLIEELVYELVAGGAKDMQGCISDTPDGLRVSLSVSGPITGQGQEVFMEAMVVKTHFFSGDFKVELSESRTTYCFYFPFLEGLSVR